MFYVTFSLSLFWTGSWQEFHLPIRKYMNIQNGVMELEEMQYRYIWDCTYFLKVSPERHSCCWIPMKSDRYICVKAEKMRAREKCRAWPIHLLVSYSNVQAFPPSCSSNFSSKTIIYMTCIVSWYVIMLTTSGLQSSGIKGFRKPFRLLRAQWLEPTGPRVAAAFSIFRLLSPLGCSETRELFGN